MSGQRQRMTGTRKSFKAFCSGSSMKAQIYKDKQSGYYSVRQEQFLTDKERGPDGQFGPEWGEIEFREEENYYFKLSQHKEWLLQYLDNRADAVIPDFRQTELRNAVEKISGDLCISRPKSRLDWGIELPFDKDFVTYVWFDALTNYISFAGYNPTVGEADSFPTSSSRTNSETNGLRCKSSAKTFSFPRTAFTGSSCCMRLDFPTTKCRNCWCTAGGTSAAQR